LAPRGSVTGQPSEKVECHELRRPQSTGAVRVAELDLILDSVSGKADMLEWYYASGGIQQGPVSWEELRSLADSGQLRPDDLVWKKGMNGWVPASIVPNLIPSGIVPPQLPPSGPLSGSTDRLAAGLLAILLGSLGVHKFMLGMTTQGMVMLLSTLLTCGIAAPVMHVIGIIEGVIYLSKSDAEFYQQYVVEKRHWF
jgi:TM2 domain-containing membrane protein YozV